METTPSSTLRDDADTMASANDRQETQQDANPASAAADKLKTETVPLPSDITRIPSAVQEPVALSEHHQVVDMVDATSTLLQTASHLSSTIAAEMPHAIMVSSSSPPTDGEEASVYLNATSLHTLSDISFSASSRKSSLDDVFPIPQSSIQNNINAAPSAIALPSCTSKPTATATPITGTTVTFGAAGISATIGTTSTAPSTRITTTSATAVDVPTSLSTLSSSHTGILKGESYQSSYLPSSEVHATTQSKEPYPPILSGRIGYEGATTSKDQTLPALSATQRKAVVSFQTIEKPACAPTTGRPTNPTVTYSSLSNSIFAADTPSLNAPSAPLQPFPPPSVNQDTLVALLKRKGKEIKSLQAKMEVLESKYTELIRENRTLLSNQNLFIDLLGQANLGVDVVDELLKEDETLSHAAVDSAQFKSFLQKLSSTVSQFNANKTVFKSFLQMLFPNDEEINQLFKAENYKLEFHTLQSKWIQYEEIFNKSVTAAHTAAKNSIHEQATLIKKLEEENRMLKRKVTELKDNLSVINKEKVRLMMQLMTSKQSYLSHSTQKLLERGADDSTATKTENCSSATQTDETMMPLGKNYFKSRSMHVLPMDAATQTEVLDLHYLSSSSSNSTTASVPASSTPYLNKDMWMKPMSSDDQGFTYPSREIVNFHPTMSLKAKQRPYLKPRLRESLQKTVTENDFGTSLDTSIIPSVTEERLKETLVVSDEEKQEAEVEDIVDRARRKEEAYTVDGSILELKEEFDLSRKQAQEALRSKEQTIEKLKATIAQLGSASDSNILIEKLAQRQANRDAEVRHLHTSLSRDRQTLEDINVQLCLERKQGQVLKDRIRELESQVNREGTDVNYLKNVIMKYVSYTTRGDLTAKRLLPVIATLLSLSNEEKQTFLADS